MSSPKPVLKPDNRISGTSQTKKPPPPPSPSSVTASKPSQIEQTLKCPRCNSPNTKFCYYNNYSLSQPRHFCKSCRRYWTRGGALRNVPIGGGCRKTKKSIKSINNNTTTATTTLFSDDSSKFFAGLVTSSSQSPDFASLSLTNPNFNQSTNFDIGSGLSLMNFGDYQSPAFSGAGGGVITGDGSLASSIETLSCLNQDLHWRLQQQRMSMLFGNSKEENVVVERPQPILYRNLEIMNSSAAETKKLGEEENNNQTEWYFGNINDNQGVISNNNNNNTGGSSEWSNGIQAWTDLNHYNALP